MRKTSLDCTAGSEPYHTGSRPVCQDVFRAARERVTARQAADTYGISVDRHGKALCPFHHDHHPSMSFKDGRFRCWSCGAAGDSIEFTGKLFGLKPLDAVRKLDADFSLGLELDRPLSPAEREQARREAQRRAEVKSAFEAFNAWREDTIRLASAAYRAGHEILTHTDTPDELEQTTEEQAYIVKWMPWALYLCDALEHGPLEEQITIYKMDDKEVSEPCRRVLRSSRSISRKSERS